MNKGNFTVIKPKADENVVDQLKAFVSLAQRGEIKNVIIIAERRNLDPLFVQVGECDPIRTLGVLDWIKVRWRELEVISWQSGDRIFGNLDEGTEEDDLLDKPPGDYADD